MFDVGVAYKEDVDRVMAVINELGEQIRKEPPYSAVILEPLTMLGVDALADSAVIIKFYIKTRPLQQWTVKRELLRRIKTPVRQSRHRDPFPHRTDLTRCDEASPKLSAVPSPHLLRTRCRPHVGMRARLQAPEQQSVNAMPRSFRRDRSDCLTGSVADALRPVRTFL